MKTEIAAGAALGVLVVAPRALAIETRADIETDHIAAADDGGPRSAALLLRPFIMAPGEVGAEIEVALGESIAASVEGDWLEGPGEAAAYGAAIGLALFPQRFAFHGVYVHPRLEWASALGAAATMGYELTWPVGATVRFGGGASYCREGVRPRLDAALGWVF